MSDNVVNLIPDNNDLFGKAKERFDNEILVLGYDDDGLLQLITNTTDQKELLWMVEQFKQFLLSVEVGHED